MNNESPIDVGPAEHGKLLERRLFLQSMGRWSVASIAAAVFGSVWFAGPPATQAAGWINRRGGGDGGWINGRGGWGGGGSWVNGGGGGWVNRRSYGGGGSWINRW
jgi:hypothetical protein